MRLEYKPQAIKQLKRLPMREKKKVIRKLKLLATQPHSGKSLRGELEGLRSLRAWPYRVIYKLSKRTVTVFSIAHRQAAYT